MNAQQSKSPEETMQFKIMQMIADEGISEPSAFVHVISQFLNSGYTKRTLESLFGAFGPKYDEVMQQIVEDPAIESYFTDKEVTTFKEYILDIFIYFLNMKLTQEEEDKLFQSFLSKGVRCVPEYSNIIDMANYEKLCCTLIDSKVPSHYVYDYSLGTSVKVRARSMTELIKEFHEIGLKLEDYIKIYPRFCELTRLEREIKDLRIGLTEERRIMKNEKELQVYELSNEIEALVQKEPGKLFYEFLHALENLQKLEYFILSLNSLQKRLEDLLGRINKGLRQEICEPQVLKEVQLIKEEISKMIQLSCIEFFWRELYLLMEKASPALNIDLICEQISDLISSGLGIEIIDGLNMYLPYSTLKRIFEKLLFEQKFLIITKISTRDDQNQPELYADTRRGIGVRGGIIHNEIGKMLYLHAHLSNQQKPEFVEYNKKILQFAASISHLLHLHIGGTTEGLKKFLNDTKDTLNELKSHHSLQPIINWSCNTGKEQQYSEEIKATFAKESVEKLKYIPSEGGNLTSRLLMHSISPGLLLKDWSTEISTIIEKNKKEIPKMFNNLSSEHIFSFSTVKSFFKFAKKIFNAIYSAISLSKIPIREVQQADAFKSLIKQEIKTLQENKESLLNTIVNTPDAKLALKERLHEVHKNLLKKFNSLQQSSKMNFLDTPILKILENEIQKVYSEFSEDLSKIFNEKISAIDTKKLDFLIQEFHGKKNITIDEVKDLYRETFPELDEDKMIAEAKHEVMKQTFEKFKAYAESPVMDQINIEDLAKASLGDIVISKDFVVEIQDSQKMEPLEISDLKSQDFEFMIAHEITLKNNFWKSLKKRFSLSCNSPKKKKKSIEWVFDHEKPFRIIERELKQRMRLDTIKQSRTVALEVIQKISSVIEEVLIKKANDELKVFNLELKVETKKAFYEYAIKAVYDNDLSVKKSEINEVIAQYKIEKEIFNKCMITQFQENIKIEGKNINEETALMVADKIQRELLKMLGENSRKELEAGFMKHEKKISRFVIQRDLDNSLTSRDEQWLLRYINNPIEIIEEEFDRKIEHIKKKIIGDIQKKYTTNFNQFVSQLIGRTKNLEKLFTESEALSMNFTQLSKGSNMRENSIYFIGQSVIRFIFLYLTNDIGNKLSLDNYIGEVLSKEKLNLPSTFVPRKEDISVLMKSRDHFWYSSITNATEFVKCLLMKLEELSNLKHAPVNSDEQEAKYRDRAIGCQIKCPCCARLCDVEHYRHETIPIGSPGNKHKCRLGHQIRGMNGIRIGGTNEASVKICSEITNLEMIVYRNRRMTWKDFKEYYNTWDFETSEFSKKEIIKLRGKFRHVWHKVGLSICSYYSDPIPMKFVEYNKVIWNNFHYIFMIDGSGSMKTNDGWKNMMEGLSTFFDEMIKARSESKISTIIFSEKISTPITNQPFTTNLIDSIQFPDGGTDFGCAFRALISLLRQYRDNSKFRIIFMSDGQDEISLRQEIEEITKKYKKDIDMFWTIGYAQVNYNILQHITNSLGGVLLKTLTGLELQNQLDEICAYQN